jgi:hypothetical protein
MEQKINEVITEVIFLKDIKKKLLKRYRKRPCKVLPVNGIRQFHVWISEPEIKVVPDWTPMHGRPVKKNRHKICQKKQNWLRYFYAHEVNPK